jgi:hypothetical protein
MKKPCVSDFRTDRESGILLSRMARHPATAGHKWSPPVLPLLPMDRFSSTFMTACAIPSPVTLNSEIALDPTLAYVAAAETEPPSTSDAQQLGEEFQRMLHRDEVAWEQSYDLVEKLGAGGQGVVFLADRHGAFDVKFRLALKFFRPDGYPSVKAYRAMRWPAWRASRWNWRAFSRITSSTFST